MSIKRKVARGRIKLRKMQEERKEKQITRLGLQRNKALKDAEQSMRLAKAKEETRAAKVKQLAAKNRLNADQRAAMDKRKKKAQKTFKKLQAIGKSFLKKRKARR